MSTLSLKYRKLIGQIKDKLRPTIKVLFIGKGKHATTNLYPSLPYAGIEVVKFCTRDWRDNLKGVDAVIACCNAQAHYEIAKEIDLPLFVEKPPAATSAQAYELKDKNIMVGFNKRFSPVFRKAKELIPHPVSMTVNVNVGKCKTRKELYTEVGIHYVDLFRYFGVDGQLQLSDKLNWENATEHIELLGEGKIAIIDNGELTLFSGDITVYRPNRFVPDKENHLIYTNGYIGELLVFADCVAHKKPFSPNMKDGYEALRRIEEML